MDEYLLRIIMTCLANMYFFVCLSCACVYVCPKVKSKTLTNLDVCGLE